MKQYFLQKEDLFLLTVWDLKKNCNSFSVVDFFSVLWLTKFKNFLLIGKWF